MDFNSQDIKKITNYYLTAVLFGENDDNDEPLDRNYSITDFTQKAVQKATKDVTTFLKLASSILSKELLSEIGDGTLDLENIGHDLYFTRQGHGVGFWESEWEPIGDELTKICKKLGEVYFYVNDFGEIDI